MIETTFRRKFNTFICTFSNIIPFYIYHIFLILLNNNIILISNLRTSTLIVLFLSLWSHFMTIFSTGKDTTCLLNRVINISVELITKYIAIVLNGPLVSSATRGLERYIFVSHLVRLKSIIKLK